MAVTLVAELPVHEPIVEGLLWRGQVGMLAASPNVGKTPLLAQLASCVAAGVPILGRPTAQGRVCVIDMESDAAEYAVMLQRQWAALGIDPRQDMDLFCMTGADDNARELQRVVRELGQGDHLAWLLSLVRQHAYALVVIDTLFRFHAVDSKDEEASRRVFRALQEAATCPSRPGIVFSHHLRKVDRRAARPSLITDPHAWIEEAAGTHVYMASTDVRLGLEPLDADREQVVLAGFRRGASVVGPILMERDYGADDPEQPRCWRLTDRSVRMAQLFGACSEGERVLRCMPGDEWLTWREIHARSGVSKATTTRTLTKAANASLIEVDSLTSRKRYRRLTE